MSEEIKQAIKTIVEAGGTVQFPHKTKWSDWIETKSITRLSFHTKYVADYKTYNNFDEAFQFFAKQIFTHKNIGLAFANMYHVGLLTKDIDNYKEEELKKLVKQYFRLYGKDLCDG